MERKIFSPHLKQVDEDQGVVEAIFAVFGNMDAGGDRLVPGSFKKTIQERFSKIRVLDHHNVDSISRVLGKLLDIQEIKRDDLPAETKAQYPDASGGVMATIRFFLDTPEGKGAFIKLKEGAIDEWSFGYDAVDIDYVTEEVNGRKVKVRLLKQIRLYEISPVLFGMNSATTTVGAKASDWGEADPPPEAETKAVTPFQDFPLADRDRPWDSSAAEKRIRAWAGGEEDMDWDTYALGFMWHDSENPETFGAYKLPYIDILEDEPHAVPRAIFTLTSSQRGVDASSIPEADKERIRDHVRRYYAKMRDEYDDDSLVPTWDKAEDPEAEVKDEGGEPDAPEATPAESGSLDPVSSVAEEGQSITLNFTLPKTADPNIQAAIVKAFADALAEAGLSSVREPEVAAEETAEAEPAEAKMMGQYRIMGDVLEGTLHYHFTCLCDKWYIAGMMDRDERILLSSLIGDALDLLHNGMPPELAMRALEDHHGMMYDYYSLDLDPSASLRAGLDAKAGRVLSARNAQKIQQALAVLHEVLMEAGLLGGEEEAEQSGRTPRMREPEEDDEKAFDAFEFLRALYQASKKSLVSQQQPPQAGPGPQDPPTSPEAGPNSASPTSQDQDLLRLIEIEQAELDLNQI